jgi:hypothetical protein
MNYKRGKLLFRAGKFLTLMYTVAITACSGYDKSGAVRVDPDKARPVLLSELVDSVTDIRLETADSCLVGSIGKVKYRNHRYYVMDYATKAIYIFDEHGKFVSRLSHYGPAPFEYLHITDFAVDRFGNIRILDSESGTIKGYSAGGDFRFTFRNDAIQSALGFVPMPEGKYILYTPFTGDTSRLGVFVFDTAKKTNDRILGVNEYEPHSISAYTPWTVERHDSYSVVMPCTAEVYDLRGEEIVGKTKFDIANKYSYASKSGCKFAFCSQSGNMLVFGLLRFAPDSDEVKMLYGFYSKTADKLNLYSEIRDDIGNSAENAERSRIIYETDGRLYTVIEGQTDADGEELNPTLQIWHIKKELK